jgi:uncharacterized protein (TIGR02677 family)
VAESGGSPKPRVLNQVILFTYVTAPNAPTYRAILETFFLAKQHFTIDLRPAEILESLRRSPYVVEIADEKGLELSLEQLVEWGNLFRSHDSAAVGRIDDFYRKRFVYHLSGPGEAAYRAVREVEDAVGKQGELQSGMLGRILDSLHGLIENAGGRGPDSAGLNGHFWGLFSAFDSLTEQATRFIGELHRRLDDRTGEGERFALMKDALLSYISRFVEQLRRLEGQIAARIREVENTGVHALIEVASRTADVPPGFGDSDPRQAWIKDQREKWDGVLRWFVGGQSRSSPIVEGLAKAALNAVVGLTRALGKLNDRQSGRAGRKMEFLELARRFAASPDAAAAHEIWRGEFGLYPARHFHLDDVDSDLSNAAASWWDAVPVEVNVQLRIRGRISRAGRPSPVPDRSGEKRWIAERQKREREQVKAARQRFAGRGELRLRTVVRLGEAEFDLLFELLDEALTAPKYPDGTRRATTADGSLDILLSEPSESEELIEIDTPRGRVCCRDFVVTVAETRPRVVREKEGNA